MKGDSGLEHQILSIYLRNTYLSLSINQIAKKLGKSYPHINHKVNELVKEGILKKLVVGRSHLCSLNLENPKTRLLLGLIEIEQLEQESPELREVLLNRLRTLRKEGPVAFSLLRDRTVYLCSSEKKAFSKSSLPEPWNLQLKDPEEMELLLSDSALFSDHLILTGFDRYYEFLNDHGTALRTYHDPLRNHHA